MKILFITPRLPYPPHRGDKLRVFNQISYLASRHELHVLSLSDHPKDTEYAVELRKVCASVQLVEIHRFQKYLNVLRGVFTSTPFQVMLFQSRLFEQQLQQKIQQLQPDVLHIHLVRMAPYVVHLSIPKVVDATDSMSMYLERRLRLTTNVVMKLILLFEWKRMLRYEAILEQFDASLLCSDVDRRYLLQIAPKARFELIRNMIDLNHLQFVPFQPESQTIIFTGNMTYAPNVDGLLYFYREIFPLVRQRYPQARLYVVGQSPPPAIQRLANDQQVVVTGFVPDLRDYYRRAQVAICPMRFGSGTPFKLTEPMALGVPVVSTTVAASGLDVEHEHNILLGDSREQFAEQIMRLFEDRELHMRIAQNARQLMEQAYDRDTICAQLEKVYTSISQAVHTQG
jgi:sugar transferase (PEP-CTERM/EpsH1 system associated)